MRARVGHHVEHCASGGRAAKATEAAAELVAAREAEKEARQAAYDDKATATAAQKSERAAKKAARRRRRLTLRPRVRPSELPRRHLCQRSARTRRPRRLKSAFPSRRASGGNRRGTG